MGPVEYEALAEQVDGIMSAVVVGVPDLVKGEVPVVLIVPGWDSADREALAEAARSKILGAMGKAMSRAAIVVVEALPVTLGYGSSPRRPRLAARDRSRRSVDIGLNGIAGGYFGCSRAVGDADVGVELSSDGRLTGRSTARPASG